VYLRELTMVPGKSLKNIGEFHGNTGIVTVKERLTHGGGGGFHSP
jgi:hypothetical protein